MSIKQIMKFQSDKHLDTQPFSWENESMSIIEELLEAKGYDVPKSQRQSFLKPLVQYIRSKASTTSALPWKPALQTDTVDAFADIIVFCVGAIMKLGYNPEKVLTEVAKEINSRKGKIIGGKFEKYLPDDEKYEKPYKANFAKCKT